MNLRCLVIDDETHAIEVLARFIALTPGLELAGTATLPVAGLELLKTQKPDILFLDIEMPVLSGISVAELAGASTAVVFTTSHRDYGPEAFRLQAADYLLKPIAFERFLLCVQRLQQRTDNQPNHFFVSTGNGQLERVVMADILFISAMANYVEIHSKNGKVLTYGGISEIATLLPAVDFMRIHRSHIISLAHLLRVEGDEVELTGGKRLTIGRQYQEAFRQRVRNWK